MRFKVISVKNKRWWPRFSQAKTVLFAIQHDDPNDWPLYGQIKVDVEDPAEAAKYRPGQVYDMDLTLVEDVA